MDAPIPFPTAVYLGLYLVTLWVHIAFMNYVLAGSAVMAATLLVRGRPAAESPVFSVLRDWMPFMLSAAITAGIAPLLFLQVLYQESFYTANLLLFARWMLILPALIAGFYLAYLLKAKLVQEWPAWGRLAAGCGAFACFAFVGWSWVENHLLSVQPEAVWRAQYASGSHVFRSPELLPRLLLWFVASFPTMSLIVGWQLWDRARRTGGDPAAGARTVALVALGGIVASALWSARYYFLLDEASRNAVAGPSGRPWLILSIAGGALEFAVWAALLARRRLSGGVLLVASAGLVVNFVGTGVMNESIRLVQLDAAVGLPALHARHAESWKVSGLPVFLFFLVLNGVLMALCVRRARRAPPQGG